MAQCGAVLIYYRARFCKLLADYAASAHRECSGGREELTLAYRTVGTVVDPMAPQERSFSSSWRTSATITMPSLPRVLLSGPHKDDIEVSIGGAAARAFPRRDRPAPRRFSLKLAERDIFRELTGFSPVLLLDDVLSELDPRQGICPQPHLRRPGFFITCCEEDRLESMLGGKVLHVENGRVV